jgi:hypothetical protein
MFTTLEAIKYLSRQWKVNQNPNTNTANKFSEDVTKLKFWNNTNKSQLLHEETKKLNSMNYRYL